MQVEFTLDAFCGPLDLLMHLIEKNKIDIYDIPIAMLTDQYMEAINTMHLDMDSNSEFLVMASDLLYLKARSLLPREKNEEEEADEQSIQDELVRKLVEYRMFQEISKVLTDQESAAGEHVLRDPSLPREVLNYKEPVDLDVLLSGLDQEKLHRIFRMLMRKQEDIKDPVRSGFGKIRREPVKIGDCIVRITDRLSKKRRCSFTEILMEGGRFELVVSFLAVLELMKAGQLTITQEEIFGDIMMEATDQLSPVTDEMLQELTEY